MIRKATIYDIFKIADMWAKMEKERGIKGRDGNDAEKEKFLCGLTKKIYNPVRTVLVDEQDGEVVAFIMNNAYYREYGVSHMIGTCEHIYVEPKYRDQDIAGKLIETSKNINKAMGVKEYEFIVKYDPELIKGYERKGYTAKEVIFTQEV